MLLTLFCNSKFLNQFIDAQVLTARHYATPKYNIPLGVSSILAKIIIALYLKARNLLKLRHCEKATKFEKEISHLL